MAVSFRLYSLTAVSNGTGGTRLVTSNEIVPDILTMSEIEEVLERDGGGFRLGNASVTVRGVPEDYFRTCGNVNTPVVFEVGDGNTAIFHGPVDPASVEYDQGRGLTSFTARSWESVLAQAASLPARSVYETALSHVTTQNEAGQLPLPVLWFREETPINTGDTVVIDGPSGEIRERVRSASTVTLYGHTWRQAVIDTPPTVYPVTNEPRTGRTRSSGRIEIDFSEIASERVREHLPENGTYDGEATWFGQSGQTAELLLRRLDGTIVTAARVRFVQYRASNGGVQARAQTTEDSVTDAQWNETAAVDLRVNTQIRPGNTVKILGRDFYGYAPTGDTAVIQEIVEAMLFVGESNTNGLGEGRPLGVLPNVVRLVEWEGFPTPLSEQTISTHAELPDRPIDALRLLQNTGGFFIRMEPAFVTTQGFREPAVTVRFVSRASVETQTPVQAPDSIIYSWNEKAVPDTIKAVVVKPNREYRKPKTESDYAGVWFEDEFGLTPDALAAITSDADGNGVPDGIDRLRFMSVPTGDGVVEVEMAVTPSWRGAYAFGGGDKQTVNDDRLKARARTLWSYYAAGGRQFNARLALGYEGSALVGKRVSFAESGLTATVFITSRSVSVKEGALNTTISGIIEPVYTEGTPLPPVAVISGSLNVTDPDADGQATVVLNGARSYSPTSAALTYAWERRPAGSGTWTYIGSGVEITDTVTVAVGTTAAYEYQLTVTAGGQSDTDTETVLVAEAPIPTNTPTANPRDYFDTQYVNTAGDGEVRLYLLRPDLINRVLFREAASSELPEIVWGNPPTPEIHYPSVRLASSGVDNIGEYWQESVPITGAHLSYIEAYVEFAPSLGYEPLIVRWSFDADTLASLRDVTLWQTNDNRVYMSVRGDEDTTRLAYSVNGGATFVVNTHTIEAQEIVGDAEPGDIITVVVTPYSTGAGGDYVPGDSWTRAYTYTLPYTPTGTTEGTYFTLTPSERGDAPLATGTIIFDQDTGDGAGNRAGIQVRHPAGFATVWDQTNDGPNSGLDADLLHGHAGSLFTRRNAAESVVESWLFAAGLSVSGSGLFVEGTATVFDTATVTVEPALTLNTQAQTTAHAVRADRTISTGVSLVGGGNLTGDLTLNTVQNIRTTDAPQFARLGLGRAATSEALDAAGNVYADGSLASRGNGVILHRPVTAGGWARGMESRQRAGQTEATFAGIGFLGTGDAAPTRISLGFGSAWYDTALSVSLNNDPLNGLLVGIGRPDPAHRLDVAGTSRFSDALYTDGAGVQVGSVAFQSGFGGSGYRIGRYLTDDASVRYGIEADSMTIRGTFSVYELIAREISAVNGNLFISAQNEIESVVSAAPAFVGNGNWNVQRWNGTPGDVPLTPAMFTGTPDDTFTFAASGLDSVSRIGSDSGQWPARDNYKAKAECWIKVASTFTVNGAVFSGDDSHYLYIDGVQVAGQAGYNPSGPTYNYTFTPGVYHIAVLWAEGQGGDYAQLGWNPALAPYNASVEWVSSTDPAAQPAGAGENAVLDVVEVRGPAKLTAGSYVIGQMLVGLTQTLVYRGRVAAAIQPETGTNWTLNIERIEGTPEPGMTLARYDHATDPDQRGYIYIATSDDGAPYEAVRYGDGAGQWPPAGGNEMVRLGNLSGLNIPAVIPTTTTGTNIHEVFGLAVGSVGSGGWATFRSEDGVEFWQGVARVGYINNTGLFIGHPQSFLRFDAGADEFELRLGGRELITATSTASGAALFLGDGTTSLRLTGESIHINGSTTFASGYSPADVSQRAETIINSRRGEFITNSAGTLGDNTNFSAFAFDRSIPLDGAEGTFRIDGPGGGWSGPNGLIPVDPDRTMRFGVTLSAADGQQVGAAVFFHDADGYEMTRINVPEYEVANTRTTLTAQLSGPDEDGYPGDTVLNVASTAGWKTNAAPSWERNVRLTPYTSPAGVQYERHGYSRYTAAYTSVTPTQIVLSQPWQGPTLPAGTSIANNINADILARYTFPWIVPSTAGLESTGVWTRVSFTVGPEATVQTGIVGVDRWPTGVASARFVINPNVQGTANGRVNAGLWSARADTPTLDQFGDAAFVDRIEAALLGTTVIQGGYLRTDLIDVDSIFAQDAFVSGTLTAGVNGMMFGDISLGNPTDTLADFGIRIDADNLWRANGEFRVGGPQGIVKPAGGSVTVGTNVTVTGTLQTGTATATTGAGAYVSGQTWRLGTSAGDYVRSNGGALEIYTRQIDVAVVSAGTGQRTMHLSQSEIAFGAAAQSGYDNQGAWIGLTDPQDQTSAKFSLRGSANRYFRLNGTSLELSLDNAFIGPTSGWLGASTLFAWSGTTVTAGGWTIDSNRFTRTWTSGTNTYRMEIGTTTGGVVRGIRVYRSISGGPEFLALDITPDAADGLGPRVMLANGPAGAGNQGVFLTAGGAIMFGNRDAPFVISDTHTARVYDGAGKEIGTVQFEQSGGGF